MSKNQPVMFYSPDGTPIHICLPDGRRATVTSEPRELPGAMNRAAIKAGCYTTNMPSPDQTQGPEVPLGEDPLTRRNLVVSLIREAHKACDVEGEIEDDYAEAFTRAGIPNLKWLNARLGFNIDSSERDQAWAAVQKEIEQAQEAA